MMNKRVVWVSLCLGSFLLLVGSMFWGVQGTRERIRGNIYPW